jgi:hypothetical protein
MLHLSSAPFTVKVNPRNEQRVKSTKKNLPFKKDLFKKQTRLRLAVKDERKLILIPLV